jgi:hypothetical protein
MKPHHLALASLLTVACSGDLDGPDCEDGNCDSNGGIIATRNPNVDLLGSYSTLFDKALPSCLEIDGAARNEAGSLSQSSELVYVNSREELARELGVDLDVQVKYAGVADGNLGMEMLNKFNTSSSAVTMLLKYESSYLKVNRSTPRLTARGEEALSQGADAFYRDCGDRYVNAVRYGSSLYVMLTYETQDEDSANSLKAKLTGSGGNGAVSVDANVETTLVETASSSEARVTLTVKAAGARSNSTVSVSDLQAEGLTANLFPKIDQMVADAAESLRNDLCHDGSGNNCSGAEERVSAVTGLSVGFYDPLASDPGPLSTITEQTAAVKDFITHWTRIQERTRSIYDGEIAPFLAANAGQQARFQVLPPAEPVATVPELRNFVTRSDSDFFPETGFFTSLVDSQIVECWNGASLSLSTDACDHGTADNVSAFSDIEEALFKYERDARVVPMRVRIGTEDKDDNEAADYCRSFNTESTTYRMPVLLDSDLNAAGEIVAGELAFIAPLVRFGNVEWNGDSTNEIWIRHANPEALCQRLGEEGSVPAYANDPATAGGRIVCHSGSIGDFGHDNTVICVPDSGPVSSRNAP